MSVFFFGIIKVLFSVPRISWHACRTAVRHASPNAPRRFAFSDAFLDTIRPALFSTRSSFSRPPRLVCNAFPVKTCRYLRAWLIFFGLPFSSNTLDTGNRGIRLVMVPSRFLYICSRVKPYSLVFCAFPKYTSLHCAGNVREVVYSGMDVPSAVVAVVDVAMFCNATLYSNAVYQEQEKK